jgi:hypothetical protein
MSCNVIFGHPLVWMMVVNPKPVHVWVDLSDISPNHRRLLRLYDEKNEYSTVEYSLEWN